MGPWEESVHKSRRATGFDTRSDLVIVTVFSFDGSGVFDPVQGCETVTLVFNSKGLNLCCGTFGGEDGICVEGVSVGLG